ncbi:superoxide dismutase [Bacillus sp. FJAT-52991]|uniref:superoxide dismutase n=1 Tax=Bacillus kandeliae TaxID=3129297 RepID=A0ABZ2NA19_9BACI
MTNYQQFIKEAKQWCEQGEGEIEPERLTEWTEQLDELETVIDQQLLQKKMEALYREWDEWYQSLNGERNSMSRVPIGGHKLPPLPYRYDALEPYIDEATMRLHHDIHHQGYVDGLNKAEKEMEKARKKNDYALIKHWEREAAFNGAGHYLHSIFWKVMCPKGGGQPTGELEREITRSFGGFSPFKQHFSAAAEKVEGSGWAILVWAPQAKRLEILQAEKHQNLSQWDVVPLLVLDVWEHAYYLKYQSKRKEYIQNWWNVVCWDEVAKRLQRAKTI